MSNEYKILCNSDTLIISFASMGQLINNHKVQFEFVNYLTHNYNNKADFYFFMDPEKVHYHHGIPGITTSIQETVEYLKNIIQKGNYKKVIYMRLLQYLRRSLLKNHPIKRLRQISL